MKKIITLILSFIAIFTLTFSFTACGNDQYTITVGASAVPHAEILEVIKDQLAEDGYTLKIKIFDDYVLPNRALQDGDIDANYFQHEPYLNEFNKTNGTDLVSVAKIHYEPFGIYGKNVDETAFSTVKTGRTILVPSDGSNCTRALLLLQDVGYIVLKDGASASDSLTDQDIEDDCGNTVRLLAAETLPAQLKNANDGTLAVINGNYALSAGLDVKKALACERSDGATAQLYANLIAVKKGNETSEKTLALVKAILSDAVKTFIAETYGGAVLPVF